MESVTQDELRTRARAFVVVGFAGREAELILSGSAQHPTFDLQIIRSLVVDYGLYSGGDAWAGLLRLRMEARRLVRLHATAIERIADALEQHGELSGAKIEELLEC